MRKTWIIARKDLENLVKSKYVLWSIIMMPIVFALLLPLSVHPAIFQIEGEDGTTDEIPGLNDFFDYPELTENQIAWLISFELMAVFFLLLPVILPTVLAADSFAGEKDRKTIHNLLASPITDSELYWGKVLGALIPALAATAAGAIIFVGMGAYFSYDFLGAFYFPNWDFALQLIFLSPLLALISTNVMIWVSTKTSSTRDAQQMGSFVSLILMVVIGGSYAGVKVLSKLFVVLIIFVLLIVNYILSQIGIRILDRDNWGSL